MSISVVDSGLEDWNIQLLTDDISVSSSGSQISVNQQRGDTELVVRSEQDKDDRPDSTTVNKKEVNIILFFHRVNRN